MRGWGITRKWLVADDPISFIQLTHPGHAPTTNVYKASASPEFDIAPSSSYITRPVWPLHCYPCAASLAYMRQHECIQQCNPRWIHQRFALDPDSVSFFLTLLYDAGHVPGVIAEVFIPHLERKDKTQFNACY